MAPVKCKIYVMKECILQKHPGTWGCRWFPRKSWRSWGPAWPSPGPAPSWTRSHPAPDQYINYEEPSHPVVSSMRSCPPDLVRCKKEMTTRAAGWSTTVLQYTADDLHLCFGSGSGLGPDSIRSVDPYLDPDPGGQNCPTKLEKIKKFNGLKCWMFSFEGLRLLLWLGRPLWRPGIGILQFLIQKIYKKFPAVNFLQFLVIKTLDPDRYSAYAISGSKE